MYRILLATAAALLLLPAPAYPQTNVSVHVVGGLGLPVGDGLDGSKEGPAFVAGLSVSLTETAAIVAEGQYSQYGQEDDVNIPEGVDATAKLTGANIGALFSTRPSMENPVRAYLHLGLGFTRGTGQVSGGFLGESINVSSSSTSFSLLVGIGMKYAVTESVSFMVDTRYNHALDHFDSSSQWIPNTAGLSFAFPQ